MFDEQGVDIREQVEARRVKIEEEEAWSLLRSAREVVVGRGRTYRSFDPATDSREEILAQCLGRSGTLRSPTLRVGDRIIVGFSEPMYAACLNG